MESINYKLFPPEVECGPVKGNDGPQPVVGAQTPGTEIGLVAQGIHGFHDPVACQGRDAPFLCFSIENQGNSGGRDMGVISHILNRYHELHFLSGFVNVI